MKKSIVIIIVLLILVIGGLVGFYFVADSQLTIIIDEVAKKEVNYKADEFSLPQARCTFFNKVLSRDKVKITKTLDVTKIGEQDVQYTCKQWFLVRNKIVKYTVVDTVPPEISINGDKELSIYVGGKYEEKGAKAVDNLDGDISDKIEKTGEVDTSKAGTYEITYKVKDSSKNETVATRKVVVKVRQAKDLSCGAAGTIYLTFDDGPNSYYTPVILDVLKKYNVKATFFVTNSGPDELIKREYDEGHLVAIHSASHDYATIYRSSEAFWKDINTVSDRIERITGQKSYLLRFPGGSSNTISRHYKTGIMAQLVKEVEEKGYAYFDWNVDSNDAGGTTDPQIELRNVVSYLSKSHGNVVLMHDIKRQTSLAIENIIKYGIDNGYKFDVLNKSISCYMKVAN